MEELPQISWLPAATAGAALLAVASAVAALWFAPRTRSHRALALSLLVVAAVPGAHFFSLLAERSADQLWWLRMASLAKGLWPAAWWWFSLTYARAESERIAPRLRLTVAAVALIPLALALSFWSEFFVPPADSLEPGRFLVLGPWGQFYMGVILLGMVAPLVNLEATLRASTALGRWQIKFMILGVGLLLGFEIYLLSHRLLFASMDLWMMGPQAIIVAMATPLMLLSLVRSRRGGVELALSQPALLGSITLLFVGGYLLALGGLAQLWRLIGGDHADLWQGVLLLVALTGLVALMLSSRLRGRTKQFLARHVYWQRFDYRHEWLRLTERMERQVSIDGALRVVVERLAEAFEASRVSAWLLDEAGRELHLVAAAQGPADQEADWRARPLPAATLAQSMTEWGGPRLTEPHSGGGQPAADELQRLVERTRARMIAPLVTGGRVLGLLAIGRPGAGSFGDEDLLLAGAIARQSAAHVLTARLGQELLRAREVELSQLFSTFLVHDLKNLGTALSLVGQNLPQRHADERFRDDARRVIAETIEKIREMTQKVAALGQQQPILDSADLNDVAQESLKTLNGSLVVPVRCELEPLPPIMLDRRQLRSVFTNLLLNAQQAVSGAGGVIRLQSRHRDGWAVLSVIDDGCGMTAEFIEQHLFQPFRSTKPGGLGIGLYQCRKIVEAHGGRISVDSRAGRGTTMTVAFPVHGG